MTSGEYLQLKIWLLGRIKTLEQRLEHVSNMFSVTAFNAQIYAYKEVLELIEKDFD